MEVTVTDGDGLSDSQVVVVSVTNQSENQAPAITSAATAAIEENNTTVFTVTAYDPNSGDSKQFSVSGGADQSLFTIDSSGTLSFIAGPDYETPEDLGDTAGNNTYEVEVTVTDGESLSDSQMIVVTVTDDEEVITGTIVDGYVAGAKVYQDLNNNGRLDQGEPTSVTSSTGTFRLTLRRRAAGAPVKVASGFDIGTNRRINTSMGAFTEIKEHFVISPISTVAQRARGNSGNNSIETYMGQVASYFEVSNDAQESLDLVRDNALEKMRDSNTEVSNASKEVFKANQLVMALSHSSESMARYIAKKIDERAISQLRDSGVSGFAVIGDFAEYEKLGADALMGVVSDRIVNAVDGVTSASNGEMNVIASETVTAMIAEITAALDAHYKNMQITKNGILGVATDYLSSTFTTDAARQISPSTSSGVNRTLRTFFSSISATIRAEGDSDIVQFATNLMNANVATKLIDPETVIGTNVNEDGTYPSGESEDTLTSAVESEYQAYQGYTAETIGDVFGDDTLTNFPNARVVMLTKDVSDTETTSDESEIIAGLGGNDEIHARGGKDKVVGGNGIDKLYGDASDDHLYGYANNDILNGGDGNDRIVGGLGDDIIEGGEGDDFMLGQSGNDSIFSGNGSDQLYGGSGDDTFNITEKSGVYLDTINGGADDDTLSISYSGITSLTDFSISKNTGVITLTDSFGGTIAYESIENLTVNNLVYEPVSSLTINSGSGGVSNAYWSSSEKLLITTGSSIWYAQNIDSAYGGLSVSDEFTYIGSSTQDSINLNINRETTHSGNLVVSMGDGNDSMSSAKLKNTDSIDLGDGNDNVSVMVSGTYGTPTLADLNMSLLDGGAGIDVLSFEESVVENGTTLSLATGGAINFENLGGSASDEILVGDSGANTLSGRGGADILRGGAGDDILYGYDENNDIDGGASYASGDDILYGGAGNDELYGTTGENLLDGGTGSDTLAGGNGADTYVTRVGDGGASIETADVITDFTDGDDLIGLDDGLLYSELTIEQGAGEYASDTIIRAGSEYLFIISGVSVSDITPLDFTSTSTDPTTFTGTSGDDVLVGGSGVDTFNGGAGSDMAYGGSGDDTFNITEKSGVYLDTINGGADDDTLSISYSGITSLTDFSISKNTGVITLTDSFGGTIAYESIENLTVNNLVYEPVSSLTINSGSGGVSNAYWSSSEKLLITTGSSIWYAQNIDSAYGGLSVSDEFTYIGSSTQDSINLNINRETTHSGNLVVSMGDGNDSMSSAKLKNTDSIDLGDGNDNVSVMVSGTYGTPTLADLNMSLLDGGAGIDVLSFEESVVENGTTLSLATGGAINFENLGGSASDEILVGDSGANTLSGRGGADILRGGAGDDILYGYDENNDIDGGASYASGDDILYGGAGNDELYGTTGENLLDGGTGSDTLAGGNGADTYVTRVGDGGASIETADVITDFTDGDDLIGLDDGLLYSELTIEQGAGEYASDTIIRAGSEYLAILQSIDVSVLTEADFEPVAIP